MAVGRNQKMRPPVFEEAPEHKRSWNLPMMKRNWNVCSVNMKWTPPTQRDTCKFMMFGLLLLLFYYQVDHCVPISAVTAIPRIPFLDGLHVPSSSWFQKQVEKETQIMWRDEIRNNISMFPEQQQNQRQATRLSPHGHSLDRFTMM